MSSNPNKWPTPFFCGLSFLLFAGYEVYGRYGRFDQGHSLAYSLGLISCSPFGWLMLLGTILAGRQKSIGFAMVSLPNFLAFAGACLWLSSYERHRTYVLIIALESAVLGAITFWQFLIAMKLDRLKETAPRG